MIKSSSKIALVTGSAGFIGFHLCRSLLIEGWRVIGLDGMTDYYDVILKKDREDQLLKFDNFRVVRGMVEDNNLLFRIFEEEQPSVVIHLAAQAGVRYSIENPRSYLQSNIIGTFELLEAARAYPPDHMLLASTSSAYGSNSEMPYRETDRSDHQMSFYAATKKSTENMSHSYAHLYNLPITMFRFFTVYGPWGRPDMALFKFTKAILENKPIDVYNFGEMKRDFTYIDDLVCALQLLINIIPNAQKDHNINTVDSLSPVAPFRTVNVGNSEPVQLNLFIKSIEKAIGTEALLNLMPMQAGDVPATWADTTLLNSLTNYTPKTSINVGVEKFVDWYKKYYDL
jgi:UDP-glucuronate 4-epimerase